MTVTERRKLIIDYLQGHPNCDVNEVIKQFDVTPATIRRDLTYLEQAGSITRTHGAVHLATTSSVPGFLTRSKSFTEEKRAVAALAAELVHSGDSVLLDSGTTVHAVGSELLRRPDVTLITNSLAMLFSMDAPTQNLLLTGGVYDYENLALIGPDAESFLDRISASILFLGTTGIRGCDGMTVISPFQASIKQKMIRSAQKRILVFDNSKLFSSGMILFASFSEIDTIIVPYPISDPKLRQHLDRLGVEVLVAMK